jgi:tRNA-binding protein
MEKEIIKWEDFKKVDLRVGTIIKISVFEKALKSAFKIWVDFGSLGIKKTSAQIRKNYTEKDLIGQQIIGLVNLPKKQILDMNSDFLLLGALNNESDNVIIIQPNSKVQNGSAIA